MLPRFAPTTAAAAAGAAAATSGAGWPGFLAALPGAVLGAEIAVAAGISTDRLAEPAADAGPEGMTATADGGSTTASGTAQQKHGGLVVTTVRNTPDEIQVRRLRRRWIVSYSDFWLLLCTTQVWTA